MYWQELQQPEAAAAVATTSDDNNEDHERVVFIQKPDEFARSMPLFPGQQAASIQDLMLQE